MRDWLMVGVTLLVCLVLLVFGRGSLSGGTWVEVTVIPADAANLGCAGEVGGARCAFERDGRPTGAARPLRPFVTTSGRLVALPGLFEEPAVAQWLAHPRAPDERVRVWCHARRLGHDVELPIRFGPGEPFGNRILDVADVSGCVVR